MKKLKILDYHVHTSHQYEFFKTGHDFYLTSPNSLKPNWDDNDRPLPRNVTLLTEQEAFKKLYDVVIIRSPINMARYQPFIRRKSIPIAVVQTTSPYPVPKEVRHIIWNCYQAMKKHGGFYSGKQNHYIVHGFDPEIFTNINLEKNQRILTVANVFKQRSQIMGYDLWEDTLKEIYGCDLIGHGNEKISESLGKAKNLKHLVEIYNSYSIFFNPTRESAMPRSRGEALMCGMATVSTSGFDIKKYFTHEKDILFADNSVDMVAAIKKLKSNPNLIKDLGLQARETAIKYFNLDDYLKKWNHVFKEIK